VAIHGTQGVLMTDSSLSMGALVWQMHGIIYGIGGTISDSGQLLESANSLQ
jgi:hypothetical protein